MTLTLDRLAVSGWLQRRPHPGDRRRVTIELTDAGRALANAVNADLHRWEGALELTSTGRRSTEHSLDRLMATIEQSRLIPPA